MTIALSRLIEGTGVVPGTRWEVTVIQAGLSSNQVFYPDAALREAVPLFEGARIFSRGDAEHIRGTTPDVRQLVGWISNARFIEGSSPNTGCIVAQADLTGLPEQTRNLLLGAHQRGNLDLVGFSIDAIGTIDKRIIEGKSGQVARKFIRIQSVDLICVPGAGGRLIRLIEAASTGEYQMTRDQILQLLKKYAPDIAAKLSDDATDAALNEAIGAAVDEGNNDEKPTLAVTATIQSDDQSSATSAASTTVAISAVATTDATDAAIIRIEEAARMVEAKIRARELIGSSTLPAPARERLLADFANRARFVEADVTAAVENERQYLARFAESGRVSVAGLDIQVGDRSKTMSKMLDAFFDPAHKDHRATHSFREAYINITGDRHVTGQISQCDRSKMRESLGVRFAESMDSGTLALMLGDSITRRMVTLYNIQSNYDIWRNICNIVPVGDFREQIRLDWGGYGDLPIVAESAPYGPLGSPGDVDFRYRVKKRGGTEDVTLEMIKNDDVGAIARIPSKLAQAAKRTLSRFVLDFLLNNPNLSDGAPVFSAAANNLGTDPLTAESWFAARLAMMRQVEPGSDTPTGITPQYLLIPAELEEATYNLFRQRATNNDATWPMTTSPTVLPVWYWTDPKSWVTLASPNDISTIEIGFLDGAQEPSLFVQDSPTVGSMFTNDKLTYKIRHIYGGSVLARAGLYKSLVP